MTVTTRRRAAKKPALKIKAGGRLAIGGEASAVVDDEPIAAIAPIPDDRTGWPPHPSERRDFYHRIRVFPP